MMERDFPAPDDEPSRAQPCEPEGEGAEIPDVTIPDHQLVRLIGRGSYGEVWLARNMMGVCRAVKIVYQSSFQNQRPFEREWSGICRYEPVSRSHESFIDVLHVGMKEEEGYFYYVMELGDDARTGQKVDPDTYEPRTLSGEIARYGRLPFQDCLQLGLALSQALNELHKHGLVHRDIKPSNIIFVNGVPKLADIGLVADVAEARSYVGTEGFIPPEGPGTPQADVYSLGKVLYEICTGKDRQKFPELPTMLNEFAEADQFMELNEVILHACRNEMKSRYQSAWDMHADLLVLANGGSVKRLKNLERKFARLKRIALVGVIAIAGLAFLSYPIYLEWRNAVEARERRVSASIFQGNRAMEQGDLLGALPHFAEAMQIDQHNSAEQRTHRLRIGATLAHLPRLTHFWKAPTDVSGLAVSPDGRHVLFTEEGGRGRMMDLETGEPCAASFGALESLSGISCSPDGRWLLVVSSGEQPSVRIWPAAGGDERIIRHPASIHSARFSPDGERIVTACADGTVRIWNVLTGLVELELIPPGIQSLALCASFSHKGDMVVSASANGIVWVWDAYEGKLLQYMTHPNSVLDVVFSPDDRGIATACMDFRARFWNLDGSRVLPDMNHRAGVMSVDYSPDGQLIVTASIDGMVRLWRADNFEPAQSNPVIRHSDSVRRATFDASGRRLITACIDGTVRVWDFAGATVHSRPLPPYSAVSYDGSRMMGVRSNRVSIADTVTRKELASWIADPGILDNIRLSRNGRFVVTIVADPESGRRTARVWNTDTGEMAVGPWMMPEFAVQMALSPDGKRAVAYGRRAAQVWNLEEKRPLSEVSNYDTPVRGAMFSGNGQQIALRTQREVIVLSLSGQRTFDPLIHPITVGHIEFSPDGSRMVTSCSDAALNRGFAQVWDAVSGTPVGAPMRHRDGVGFACFSPDGSRIVTISEDFTAMIWDADTGRPVSPVLQHDGQVHGAAFSPDSRWLVTCSRDQTVRLWNVETGDPLMPPLRYNSPVNRIRFLPDGSGVASVTSRGEVRIWDLPVDPRPTQDLVLLAQFLSGQSAIPIASWGASGLEPLEELWSRLRTISPEPFALTREEIARWHHAQTAVFEVEEKRDAAVFHLRQLQAVRPDDASVRARLDRILERTNVRN